MSSEDPIDLAKQASSPREMDESGPRQCWEHLFGSPDPLQLRAICTEMRPEMQQLPPLLLSSFLDIQRLLKTSDFKNM